MGTNEKTLIPCPFCGSAPIMRTGVNGGFWALCERCWAQLRMSDTEAEAIAAWNSRATEAETWTSDALENAVRIMRAAQKEYFRTRAPSALIAAKQAERAVDDMLNPKPARDEDNRQMRFDFSAPITDAEREADIREKWRSDCAERRAL